MSGCSTTQQLLRLSECIIPVLDRKPSTAAVFLNISKASDVTWHAGLVYKLIQIKFPGEIIKLINSYLTQISFRIKVGE